MAIIQVFKPGNNVKLGDGDGDINSKDQTATIQSWRSKAAVVQGEHYKLASGGKTYSDAVCKTVSNTPPVATFSNVV